MTEIWVPKGLREDEARLTVVYRADHPPLDRGEGFFDPTQVEVELPASHLQALLYFVASRLHNPIGGNVEYHEGNNYAAKYEQACRELEGGGYQLSQQADTTQFERNGWV